jgi:hypothetical protein
MNAEYVIETIKRLPPQEQQKVIEHVFALVTEGDVSDDFKRITDETFSAGQHGDLVSGHAH